MHHRKPASLIWDYLQGQRPAAARPLTVGLAGPQGAGKSTLAKALEARAAEAGLRLITLSLDDYYRTRAERAALAGEVHPLFATRGPPGTHDVAALAQALITLKQGDAAPLWRFDKGRDDRAPPGAWGCADGPWDILLLEGWCIGAAPEPEERLAQPVNALEAIEDADGRWRMAVNAALAGPYQALFAQLDRLILLTAPDFNTVRGWRAEQEQGLPPDQRMDQAQLDRFMAHFERLTRWMAQEAPARADLHLKLDASRHVTG